MLYTKIGKKLQANDIISFCLSRLKRKIILQLLVYPFFV